MVTLEEVVQVIHCGYRCPNSNCPDHHRLYRSAQADGLALPGFTFGLDLILLVGHLRLGEHKTVDAIHHLLTQRLAPLAQSISRREILFLFEAYTALFCAGTEVQQDEEWKEQVRTNKGLLLAIAGIQPDRGNEPIYLVRDVLTGRIVTADNVTESTKERLKQVLAPVAALGLPVIGVGSRRAIHRITSRGRPLARNPASNLSVPCAELRGAAHFRAGSAHQEGDARQDAAKDA